MGSEHSYKPPEGFVPNEATAIAIATAVWIPIYGEKVLANLSLRVSVSHEVWTVSGYLDPPRPGGGPVAEISQIDGRILRVSHGC